MAKIGVTAGGHPIGMGLWQVSTASVLMLVLILFARKRLFLRADVVRFGLICGGCGVAFPAIALFWCALYLPAGVMAIAFASMPLFTFSLSALLGIEKAHRRRLLGVLIGLAAMALLVLPESALPEPGLAPWVMLALVASVSMSIENTYAGGYRPEGLGSLELAFVRQFTAVLILTPIAWYTGTSLSLWIPWDAAQFAATGNGILSGVAFAILLYVIRHAGPIFASQTAYLITLSGVAWGMILFGETHSLYIWVALALTLVGISLVRPQLPKRRTAVTVET